MKQNITIVLDKELIRKARVLAAKRSTSISRMLGDQLTEIVNRAEDYARARKRALAELETGLHLGGQPATREELHER